MIKKILILTLIICATDLTAEDRFKPAGTFGAYFTGEYISSSSYYDNESDQIVKLNYEYEDETLRQYTFDYHSYSFGLKAEYSILDEVAVFAKLPFIYHTLDERWASDYDDVLRQDKAGYSHTRLDYFGLGARFKIFSFGLYSWSNIELKIPSGFHNGVLNDTDNNFWSDGALEFTPSLFLGYDFSKSWIEAGASYNFRDEELTDRILVRAEAGVKTVESSALYLTFDYASNIDMYDEELEFNIYKIPVQDEFMSFGGGIYILFDDVLETELSYKVDLKGKNSWSKGIVNLSVGVFIK